ncbi:MAG: DNA adenine methylase [Oceanospirillales bacterium]|nr:DNA adenine methylase [Oceanospirillales bacterium]MBL1273085.1 DNA adenine methylase [Oceanospirillales bacterium]
MSHSASPLRYPGGKAKLTKVLQQIISKNHSQKPTYIEPFAGGAGAALNLLFSDNVESIILNDADIRIYYFWKSILENNSEFIELIENTEISIQNWRNLREVYLYPQGHNSVAVGFATFFLNRCNRSGILPNGGPIGGQHQKSEWKIDARFNKSSLIKRIEKIGCWREKIKIENQDAINLIYELEAHGKIENSFYYIDPPYYKKGSRLYLNFYNHSDHEDLSRCIKLIKRSKWILSYDNTKEIKDLYKELKIYEYTLKYSACITQDGKEVLISRPDLKIPNF